MAEHLGSSLIIDNDVSTDNLQGHSVTNCHLKRQDQMSCLQCRSYIGELPDGVVEVGGRVARLEITAPDETGKEPSGLVLLAARNVLLHEEHLLLQLKQAGHYLESEHLEVTMFYVVQRKAMDTSECISFHESFTRNVEF